MTAGGPSSEIPTGGPIGETSHRKLTPRQQEREEARAHRLSNREQAKNQRHLDRILAGKSMHTILERAAQKLNPKRALQSLSEKMGSMTEFLRKSKEPVYQEGEDVYDGPLSKRLERFVDEGKLASNAKAYPELERELSEEEQRQVGLIRDVLLNYVPLVHADFRTIEGVDEPLLPMREIAETSRQNTKTLDRDLGLDEYVFFYWGFPVISGYGGNFSLLDAHMLLDPHTIVTPGDIYESASSGDLDKRFSQLTADKRRGVRVDYFNKVISGERWLELTARHIMLGYQQAKAEVRPYMFVQGQNRDMGEIKFHGIVPPERVLDKVSRGKQGIIDHFKSLYEHGLAYGPLEAGFTDAQDDYTNIETPDALGIDLLKARQFWANLLEPKAPSANQPKKS